MDSSFIPCRSSPMSKLGLYSAVLLYPSVAFALFFVLILIGFESYAENNYTSLQVFILSLTTVVAIVLASFLLVLSRKCYLMETRHISINSYGFIVKGRNESRYAWKEIGGIGVIAYAASASKLNYQKQICISFKPLSDDELRRLRESYLYGVFNQDKYVLLDYEGIIMDRISEHSHVQVDDLISRQMKL